MRRRLIIPRICFLELLERIAQKNSGTAYVALGTQKTKTQEDYLFHEVSDFIPKRFMPVLEVAICEEEPSLDKWFGIPLDMGFLFIGQGKCEGKWWGGLSDKEGIFRYFDDVFFPGMGMDSLRQGGFVPQQINNLNAETWSRTIGAIGKIPWQKLRLLSFAIVGCGRSGSLAAVTLARMGVKNIALVDPDVLEMHNLPEMDGVTQNDVGKSKVDALGSFIFANCKLNQSDFNIQTEKKYLRDTYKSILGCDVIISCVDNDAARLECSIIATLYHKILLDVGTGILPQEDSIVMGGDARLILPGSGCLRCWGGFTNEEEALQLVRSKSKQTLVDWQEQRLGSLRTLNTTCVHLGIQSLVHVVSGDIAQSQWIHLEYDSHFQCTIKTHANQTRNLLCNQCQRMGMADNGLLW